MKAFSKYDLVNRNPATKDDFKINDEFQERLLNLSYNVIYSFLKNLFPDLKNFTNQDESINNFILSIKEAKKQKLISYGGIPEKNYLALSLISQILNPTLYVESGFYEGCSLKAVSDSKRLKKIIAFDPDHTSFKAKLSSHLDVSLVKKDFEEYSFEGQDLTSSLLYFDDHINTAQRIIQASDKGFKNLIFDDSCGLMGSVERVFPSLPSLFFIDNAHSLLEKDKILWSKERERTFNFLGKLSLSLKKKQYFSFEFDKSTIELCYEAKNRILSIDKIPDLNDYICTERAMPNDITQHFVVLK